MTAGDALLGVIDALAVRQSGDARDIAVIEFRHLDTLAHDFETRLVERDVVDLEKLSHDVVRHMALVFGWRGWRGLEDLPREYPDDFWSASRVVIERTPHGHFQLGRWFCQVCLTHVSSLDIVFLSVYYHR